MLAIGSMIANWFTSRTWWPYAAGAALVVLAVLTAGKMGERRGVQKAKARQIERANRKLTEMQDANASVDRSRDGLAERLRRHGF